MNHKPFQPAGTEDRTEEFFVDAAGKQWPIFRKVIDLGAGPNALLKAVEYAAADLVKADGHFDVKVYFTKAGAAPVLPGDALDVALTLTHINITPTGDLTTYNGRAIIEYCKA